MICVRLVQVLLAEARGKRLGLIDKEIAEAQLKQQLVAISEEKEVLARHRLSADLLAQLSEKVGAHMCVRVCMRGARVRRHACACMHAVMDGGGGECDMLMHPCVNCPG